jgi:hypothetical protein
VYKNPRATASFDFAIALGGRCTGRDDISPTSEPESALEPITSHLEGVRNYLAACAATTFVHLHTTSFRCAYCTLHFAGCQVFSENSLQSKQPFG